MALPYRAAIPGQRRTKAMIFPLFRRGSRGPDTISTLYGMIVAQARFPGFYRDYGVADTVDGRFDLIVLHLALVLDRLAQDPALQSQRRQRNFAPDFHEARPLPARRSQDLAEVEIGRPLQRSEGGELKDRIGKPEHGKREPDRV